MKNILGRKLSSLPMPDLSDESYARTVFRRFRRHKLAMVGSVVVLALVLVALQSKMEIDVLNDKKYDLISIFLVAIQCPVIKNGKK